MKTTVFFPAVMLPPLSWVAMVMHHPWVGWAWMVIAFFCLAALATMRLAEEKKPKPFDWWVLTPNGPTACNALLHERQMVCDNCRGMRRAQFVYEHPGQPIPNILLHPVVEE